MKKFLNITKSIVLLILCILCISCNEESECKEIEFRVEGNVLEWRYTDGEWKPVYDLSELNKEDIKNEPKDLILEIIDGKLVYSYGDETFKKELIDLSTLKGEDGKQVDFAVVDNKLVYGYDNEEKTILFDFDSIKVEDAEEIVLQMSENTLQWKYSSDLEWQNLFDFSIFDKKIILEIIDNKVMYGYEDDLQELLDLSLLKGEDGKTVEFEVVDNKLMYGYLNEDKKVLFDFESLIIDNTIKTDFVVEDFILKYKESDSNVWNDLIDFKELLNEINIEINIDNVSDLTILEKVQSSLNNMIADVEKSVLGIANYQYNDQKQLVKSSVGSGFVYKVEGVLANGNITTDMNDSNIVLYKHYIITNRHVVLDSDAIKVYIFEDDEEYEAELIKYDLKDDLALVSFTHDKYIKPIKLGDSSTVKTGDFVIAIGNPKGFDYSASATLGIVSYPNRYMSVDTDDDNVNDWDLQCVQHDCAINPGNSGGPLLNIYGEVIGVNTLKFAAEEIDNMGFSISIDAVKHTISYLEKGEVVPRIVLGITIISVRDVLQMDKTTWQYEYNIPSYIENGLYITSVNRGSLAYGVFKQDDILLEFNGSKIKKALDLKAELNKYAASSGDKISAIVLRKGVQTEVILELKK